MTNEIVAHLASTMTSLEIAELVEKRHDNVKRTIDTLAEKGVISAPKIAFIEEINNLGLPQKTKLYIFDAAHKRDTYIVVAQLSPQHIGAVVDVWGRTEATLNELLAALEAFDIPDDLPPDLFIYAIRERETGNIKLGISRDPSARLMQLQTGNSSKLELVAVRPAANRFADERAIHADADVYRLRGEWFAAGALPLM